MERTFGTTLRSMLLAGVASSVLLTGCSSMGSWFSKEDDQRAAAPVARELRRPVANPGSDGMTSASPELMADAHAPEMNPNNNTGAEYGMKPPSDEERAMGVPGGGAPIPAEMEAHPAPQKKGGLFSWMYRDEPAVEATAPMAAASADQTRKVPAMNNEGAQVADAGDMGAFEASAPVSNVNEAPMASQNSYPELSTVPPRPERLDTMAKKDQAMMDLTAARNDSQAASDKLAMEADQEMAPEWATTAPAAPPQTTAMEAPQAVAGAPVPDDAAARFAALVAKKEPSAVAPSQPEKVMASVGPADTAWEPAPMIEPQAPVMAATSDSAVHKVPAMNQEAAPVVTAMTDDQWVDVRGANQGAAVPVPEVAIANAPEPFAVSPVPVVPQWHGNVEASSGVRLLPESRYAARRQAAAMQRYAAARQLSQGN